MLAQLLGMPCTDPGLVAGYFPALSCWQAAESALLVSWLWLNSSKARLHGAVSRAGDSGGDGGLEAGSYRLCATGAACREKVDEDAEKELVLSTRVSACTGVEAVKFRGSCCTRGSGRAPEELAKERKDPKAPIGHPVSGLIAQLDYRQVWC
jgi:hypothetical protein